MPVICAFQVYLFETFGEKGLSTRNNLFRVQLHIVTEIGNVGLGDFDDDNYGNMSFVVSVVIIISITYRTVPSTI